MERNEKWVTKPTKFEPDSLEASKERIESQAGRC